MFVELIATFVAGIAGAGVVLLLNHVLKGKLPPWLAPVAAGAAMLLATISSEYGWYSRTAESLPEGMVVAQTVESKAFYRPWTYVKPYVERFVAVDVATMQQHPEQPELRLAQVYFFGRRSPINKIPVLVDCVQGRRAALTDNISFRDNGAISGADWVTPAAADPMIASICKAG
ncbi:hypothetical protein [Polycladidibacter hongkongensis]|uniref:hypothetical protein n=1 Tax=Polycladidibacter hongkongensis TaxID=1647556 RepID=UPI000832E8B9|nr:hypothetical protein [Pseudovibrio hongkongensis]